VIKYQAATNANAYHGMIGMEIGSDDYRDKVSSLLRKYPIKTTTAFLLQGSLVGWIPRTQTAKFGRQTLDGQVLVSGNEALER
jgi:hypothetical protein